MTEALRTAGLLLLLLFLCFILRSVGFKGAPLVATVGIVGIIGITASGIGRIFSHLTKNELIGDVIGETVSAALKLLGVGYVFGICADICRDLGEMGIASCALAVGRVEIFLLILPYIDELLGLVAELV